MNYFLTDPVEGSVEKDPIEGPTEESINWSGGLKYSTIDGMIIEYMVICQNFIKFLYN